MQVVSIIIFSILALFVTWLVIDTILYVIRRVKQKKKEKQEQVNNDNN